MKPHVLRYWESKFKQIGPLKHGGSRRGYRREDIHLQRRIRSLLYRDGYTIKGVQQLLNDEERPIEARGEPSRRRAVTGLPLPPTPSVDPDRSPDIRTTLMDLRRALVQLRRMLSMS